MTSSDEIQQLAGLLWLQSNIKGWVAICLQHVLVFKNWISSKGTCFYFFLPSFFKLLCKCLPFFRIATLLITTGKVSSPGISRDFLPFFLVYSRLGKPTPNQGQKRQTLWPPIYGAEVWSVAELLRLEVGMF